MALIPFNDSLIKLMSARLSVFEILGIRAVFTLAVLAVIPLTIPALFALSLKSWVKLTIRGMFLVSAMLFFFLPLATLSLAETTAIFFTAPLIISLLSVPLLGESLGLYRLSAVFLGLAGVVLIVKPLNGSFQLAYLMPMISACSYAGFQLITRFMRNEAEVLAMVGVQCLVYLVVGILGVVAIELIQPQVPDGDIWQFLLRGWETPTGTEFLYLAIAGIIVLTLAFASTNVYSNVEATMVAPFEYVALPMSILWGIVIWQDWPDLMSWMGMGLILFGGIFLIYRENRRKTDIASAMPMRASPASAALPETEVTGDRQFSSIPFCF